MGMKNLEYLKMLPAVNVCQDELKKRGYAVNIFITNLIKIELAALRGQILNHEIETKVFENKNEVQDFILSQIEKKLRPKFRRVINCTGIIIHTNLGRAPLSQKVKNDLYFKGSDYCNLEFDLEKGQRGSRQDLVKDLLKALTGAEDALIVNNNAAAVLLILETLAFQREVIVSRGELVEIGGSFRVPELMKKSGVKLIEVGTTNRTKLDDYQTAINEQTALILKVHPSNFKIRGYTEEVSAKTLAQLGKTMKIPFYYDLGSGPLWEGTGEESIGQLIAQGCPLLSFSGDKLLGGAQAGIILGSQDYIKQMKQNNLMRALRIDKLSLCAIETTLRQYLLGDHHLIPVYKMYNYDLELLEERTNHFFNRLHQQLPAALTLEIQSGEAFAGGGALPDQVIKGPIICIKGLEKKLLRLYKALRAKDPAVITVLQQGKIAINLRTVDQNDEEILFQLLNNVWKEEESDE